MATTASGAPSGIGVARERSGSMRYRLPSSPSLTHAKPRPTAMPDGAGPTPMEEPGSSVRGSIGVAVPATEIQRPDPAVAGGDVPGVTAE